jgi:hypothetical protein
MPAKIDILVLGTGSFAARIIFDLASSSARPVTIAIAGRNAERLSWLKVAANARAVVFGRPAEFVSRAVDLSSQDAAADLIAADLPKVVVQAASAQASSVIATRGDAWSQLVSDGGLSATTVFQALLSTRVAQAIQAAHPACRFVNCCFPDVVNTLIAASGLPIACGVGNVAILSNAFAGALGIRRPGALRVLATYQTLTPFRRAAATRSGLAPRVWLDDAEVADVFGTFADVKLTAEPAIEISGASGVPLMLAMAAGSEWIGHVPGPLGLPGGYPVAYRHGKLELDLPATLGRMEAVSWNARFEAENGLVVDADGRVRYTGVLQEKLRKESPALAEGFEVHDLEEVYREMAVLRSRLQACPAR